MNIGELEFVEPVFLAPMAGVTDRAFRIIARKMGCPLCCAEMVSAQGIHYHNAKTLTMLDTSPEERPLSLQLFGRSPEILSEAAAYVESLHTADILDFNMGCPAPKIVNNGEGAALMREPKLVADILRALRRATKLPLTVKIRKGWDDAHINATEIARIAEAAGVDAVTVHGRTRQEFYGGRADWDIVARVKRAVKIPVVLSGDVRSAKDYLRARATTGADGVMIGRAAQGNPWIFRDIIRHLRDEPPLAVSLTERGKIMREHLALLVKFKGEYIGIREMRKHAAWYTHGLTGGAALRLAVNQAKTCADFYRLIDKLTAGITEGVTEGGNFVGQ